VVKFVFSHSKLRKQLFLLKISKSTTALLPTPIAARLNYSSPSKAGALEFGNGYLPTTWQDFALMLRNSGLLHHH